MKLFIGVWQLLKYLEGAACNTPYTTIPLDQIIFESSFWEKRREEHIRMCNSVPICINLIAKNLICMRKPLSSQVVGETGKM